MRRNLRGVLGAVGALLATLLLVVGVPVALVLLVGNPWPGRARLEMRDEVAVAVGVLAVVAWVLWARFVVALAVEARYQLAELRTSGEPTGRVSVTAPAPRHGIGLFAQRLVASALIILPIGTKVAPSIADAPAPLPVERLATPTLGKITPRPVVAPTAAPAADVAAASVTVGPGDTLIGLARTHLGDAARWRELFELNRDRQQPDGHRLLSPSGLRVGWELSMPAALPDAAPEIAAPEPASWVEAAVVTVEPGDNLWDLTEGRLAAVGLRTDDDAVAHHLQIVIDANQDIIEDPNLIYVGEQFNFPAIGTPPAPPVAEAAAAPPVVEQPPTPPPPLEVPDPTPTTVEPAPLPAEVAAPADATTTTLRQPVPPPVEPGPEDATPPDVPGSASPIGVGEAALLSAGVLALVAARRRLRLRGSQPRARVPEPPPETVATERRLRAIDAGERVVRVDVAVRAAAATLLDGKAQIAVVRAGGDGAVELTCTADAVLGPPWEGVGARWTLPGSTPIELLADAARTVGAPCIALAQLGIDDDGRDVLVDLEALGLLSIVAEPAAADVVLRGIAATLGTSVFAEVANLIGVGLDPDAFLEHRQAHHVEAVDEALELATTLVGTTASSKQSTFVLRARHTSGEAWEPAIVLTSSTVTEEVTPELAHAAARRRGGVAMVSVGDVSGAPWSLYAAPGLWRLEPIGLGMVPVGLSTEELHGLQDILDRADEPLVDPEVDAPVTASDESAVVEAAGPYVDAPWSLMVRLLGPVDVIDPPERPARFERSKTLELIAWLTLHRDRSTRAGARTALWDLDVRDATFANVVSEARRAMARHVEPPVGEEWLGRTLTEILPLHKLVVADVELVRARLDHARLQPPELAIETLRPAVAMIRDLPFSGTGYLWPDAEGITSNLVLLATSAATELAGHYLSMGDIDGVFWATGQGLKVLAGHEELIALRMRAHARAGDLSGVRMEWECYERVLSADPWSDGEPAPKLVLLRKELLAP